MRSGSLATPANIGYANAAHRTIMTRIIGYIAEHLRDPALSAPEIAAAANISVRYLHKLFEGEQESVALYLRRQRLQCARDDLLDPRQSGLSIASIAHACGFGDISGFNRAFRAAYGISPSELRQGHPRRS